jgi:tetratricopeptide (TPR) repeat protein
MMADFFISYTSADRTWAQWIGKEIIGLGHAAHVHEWEIEGGGDIYDWMEKRLDAADHVLCVVSDEYLRAPFSKLERNAALWQAAGSRPGFVLFVVVKPAKLPTLSDHIKRCELFNLDEESARLRLREFLQQRAASERISFPGEVVAVSNIRAHVPIHFAGRDETLATITRTLEQESGGLVMAALYGLRGVGKTTLAAAYAERQRAKYRATWWIRAQTDAGLRGDLTALGMRLRWASAEEKEEQALALVLDRLQHEGEGILLIYDNAANVAAIKPYLPPGGRCKIIVTSNAHNWRGVATPIEVTTWPTHVGADYLVGRTGRTSERETAEALSEALGGLPLAHEQAAALCERLEKSFADYLRRFNAAPGRLLDDSRDAPAEYHDHLTVTKTFGLAIDEASKLHPAVESFIVHAALLAPEPLPLFLFADGREALAEPLFSALADDGLDEIIAALRAFALVDRETVVDERDPAVTTQTIRLHRLVRQVASDRSVGTARELARCQLIRAVAAAYPAEMSDAQRWSEGWPKARRLDQIAHALVSDMVPEAAEESASRLLAGLAEYRHHALGAYALARPLYERSLMLRERRLGPEHSATAESLNNLGLLLRDEGSDDAALPLLERAIAINEKAFGADHPTTAVSLNNLALLFLERKEFAAARPLFERVVTVNKKAMGLEHPATAASLSNLGLVLKGEGDVAGARALFEQALGIDQKALGPDHPDTASDLSNLGLLLKQAGEPTEARRLYERALAIEEKVLGPEHPRTMETLYNLAYLLHDQGELSLARSYYERVLAISEKTLGANHPTTAADLNNLACLMLDQGDLENARLLLERALAVSEEVLGADHANTNRLRFNLAKVFSTAGQIHDALKHGVAALAAHEQALGSSHAWTLDSAGLVARALDSFGRVGDADGLRRRYKLEHTP